MREKNIKKVVIFDFDGTLVHFPFEFFFSETHRIFSQNNWGALDQKLIEDCFSDFDYFRFLREMEHLDHENTVKIFWEQFNWHSFPCAELFEESENVLLQLGSSGVYELALATARAVPREELVVELSLIGAFEHFSAIHSRCHHGLDWKDKAPQILRVLKDLNTEPQNAILIGDTPSDMVSARSVGLFGTVAVLSGKIKKDVLKESGADHIIEEISELPVLLKDWGF